MKRLHLLSLVLTALTVTSCGFLPKRATDIRQAVWITRFDYETENDVREAIRNCARSGFDTVLFQVRGNGTVLYRSKIEPWSELFEWRSPGFDPLQVACEEARLQGIAIQAWVNAVPGWRGARPPANDRQLFHTHRHWFLVDQHKKREPLRENRYVSLNPCLPEVRAHIARVCEDIALRYPVDGIHLDYIRFPDVDSGANLDYGHDDKTLDLFRQATGKTPNEDPEVWKQWRTDQVTQLVREIRRTVRRANRRCLLTAAVFRTPEKASLVHQDWVSWLATGQVDVVFPMTYTDDDSLFSREIRLQRDIAGEQPVVVGIGVYKHDDPAQTLKQMALVRETGHQGYALFAYASLFRSRAKAEPKEASLRAKRQERIVPELQSDRIQQE